MPKLENTASPPRSCHLFRGEETRTKASSGTMLNLWRAEIGIFLTLTHVFPLSQRSLTLTMKLNFHDIREKLQEPDLETELLSTCKNSYWKSSDEIVKMSTVYYQGVEISKIADSEDRLVARHRHIKWFEKTLE